MFCTNCGKNLGDTFRCDDCCIEFKEEQPINKLECSNISKKHNRKLFLNDISVSLETGDCLAVLGDNGSGKSTLMSVFAGLTAQDRGSILYNGSKITKKDRLKIGYVPQVPILIDYLTVKDNIELWKSVYKLDNTSNIPDFLEIDDMKNKKISNLSGGMKKKVSIAVALLNAPDFIIFDEAFAALDQKTVTSMLTYLKSKNDIGILYSSHSIYEIAELCNRAMVLKSGKVEYYSNDKMYFDEDNIKYLYSKF